MVRKIQPQTFYSYLKDYFKYFFNVNDLSSLDESQKNDMKELLSDFCKNIKKRPYYESFCKYYNDNKHNSDSLEFPKDFNEYINQVIPIDFGGDKLWNLVDILLWNEIRFSEKQPFKFTEYFLKNWENRPRISTEVSELKRLYERRISLINNLNPEVNFERLIDLNIKIRNLEIYILTTSFPYLESVIALLQKHKDSLLRRKQERKE